MAEHGHQGIEGRLVQVRTVASILLGVGTTEPAPVGPTAAAGARQDKNPHPQATVVPCARVRYLVRGTRDFVLIYPSLHSSEPSALRDHAG